MEAKRSIGQIVIHESRRIGDQHKQRSSLLFVSSEDVLAWSFLRVYCCSYLVSLHTGWKSMHSVLYSFSCTVAVLSFLSSFYPCSFRFQYTVHHSCHVPCRFVGMCVSYGRKTECCDIIIDCGRCCFFGRKAVESTCLREVFGRNHAFVL